MSPWDYIYDLSNIVRAIQAALGTVLPGWLVYVAVAVLGIVSILAFVVPTLLVLVYVERRVIAFFQLRQGPNRVGPIGLLQSVADAIKLLAKEDIVPAKADPWVFNFAPIVVMVPALLVFAVVPFSPTMIVADLNVGILFVLAVTGVEVIGVFMAGWASNNKYALLGAMRGVAQLVSYEVPMVLSVLGVAMMVGTLSMVGITNAQPVPFILVQPIAFLVFFICATAELNRSPLDLMEAESEIVAGYHTEYSGMKFGLFYLAEYTALVGVSGVIATLFLGGFRGPLLPPWLWLLAKMGLVIFVFIWMRATLPRLRVDQVMGLAWKVLLPLAIANIFLTGIGLTFLGGQIGVAVLNWAALIAFVAVAGLAARRPDSVESVKVVHV